MLQFSNARRGLYLIVFGLLLIGGCVTPPQSAPSIHTGQLDDRAYRYLDLPNHLRVLLVSDAKADKAAASMRVQAGSGDDPVARQGIAHFLEHMLFLGTGKYPDPAEYQAFVNAHGGSHNAYTSIDHTQFFFDIQPDALEPTLDRFAQFFVAPLFNREYVGREMNAVDSEYKMGLKEDGRREYDVLRELVQADHPLGQLSVGNLQTLGGGATDIQADLRAFYEQHYSANQMSLVVLGREPLDTLETMVTTRFGAISDRGVQARQTAPAMFKPGSLPMELRIKPEKEMRELSLLFPAPSMRSEYAGKPIEYIGNLLGHEGGGSLLSVLKAAGWAEALSAGSAIDMYDQSAFQISITLTPQGVAHEQDIIGLTFAAIAQLRDSGVAKWRFEEQGRLSGNAFRFLEKGNPVSTVMALNNALQDYPVAEVIRGPYLFETYRKDLIERYLAFLEPHNVLITLTDKGVATDRSSLWFHAPYSVRRLDPAQLAGSGGTELAGQLKLPVANEFIPRNVVVKPIESKREIPEQLVNDPDLHVWHLQDPRYPVPRGSIFIQVLSPAWHRTPIESAMAELYVHLVSDMLNEYGYPATLAGLQYAIGGDWRGIGIRISGYDDRQQTLLKRILDVLKTRRFAADRFANEKRELARSLGNSSKDNPYEQLAAGVATSLIDHNWTDEEKLAVLDTVDADRLAGYLDQMYKDSAFEVLVHGNFLRDQAEAIGRSVRAGLRPEPAKSIEDVPVNIVALQPASLPAREFAIDHPDAAVLLYVQGAHPDYAERARMALSAQIIGADFFNSLRTEQQLGYVVFAQSYPLFRVPGMMLGVQSPNTGATQVLKAINDFLAAYVKTARSMSDAEFERQRSALVDRLRVSPKSLEERSERLWTDLSLQAYGFDDREQVATAIANLTRQQWLEYFTTQIADPQRRSLLLFSQGTAARQGSIPSLAHARVASPEEIRRNAKYYRFEWWARLQDH